MNEEFVPVQVVRPLKAEYKSIPVVNKLIASEAWNEYADCGHGDQSLERIGERSGFSVGEILTLLYGRIKRLEGNGDSGYYHGMKAFSDAEKTGES